MTLEIKHFDPRLNQWIYTDDSKTDSQSILTEKLSNTLLEFSFPDKEFSFGHSDEYSTDEELKNHPDGQILLLSSKTRLLYGDKECLETIQKICPDSKDRGAYGSIFLGACKNAIHEKLNILIVDDSTNNRGENGGILSNDLAYKLVGDCYGQISTQLYDKVTLRESQADKSYRVIQHRFGWVDGVGEDTTKYRFGKGTLRPYNLDEIEYADPKSKPKIDIILPVSSFTALPAIMQYSFSPCPLVSKLSDLGMYLIAAVSAVREQTRIDPKGLLKRRLSQDYISKIFG